MSYTTSRTRTQRQESQETSNKITSVSMNRCINHQQLSHNNKQRCFLTRNHHFPTKIAKQKQDRSFQTIFFQKTILPTISSPHIQQYWCQPQPSIETGELFHKARNDFLQKSTSEKVIFKEDDVLPLYNYYIRIIKMSNDRKQDWIQLIDLQSYSFDGFYNKNQFLIDQAEPFEIQLNNVPPPSIHVDYMLETRMETNHTHYPLMPRRDEEDYFYIDSGNQGSKQRQETFNDDENPQGKKDRESPEQFKKNKKIKKERKSKKNQYDKNIFANITAVIIKKMLSQSSESQLQYYCQQKEVDLQSFRSYFTTIQRSKSRLGTTQLASFYQSKEKSSNFKSVFSMFMIRFLREQYLLYVICEGKMQEKQKYLRCATKLMYIPRLRKEEYGIISNLMNKV